ncbi:hypothetical protein PG994_007178 [Apiospora phragmitis]|uniref:FAD-binding domain-containing protein n=1 Tax=Apiospora phragmitis TaxID=2905665 RepID=A0ABR1V029_9PEZI
MADKKKFKAIIIGGGPVGMYLAHALQETGIDYVLCEKRDAIPPPTAFGLFLWPYGLRLLHQVGLLVPAHPHGYPVRMFDRASLGHMLYDTLREPAAHIRTGRQLVDVERRAGGVTAHFAGGSREEGSIIIGADGIWSTVRDFMRRDAPEGLFDEFPYVAGYRAVFGRSPLPSSSASLELERQPRRGRKGFDYTVDASDAAIAPWLETRITNDLTFRNLWQSRAAAGGAGLDEGMVLPNQGMGANGGFEGAASLVNQLSALLRHESDPGAAELRQAFLAYQAERQGVMAAYQRMARDELDGWTRSDSKGGPPLDALRATDVLISPMVARSVRLDSVPFPDERAGFSPWLYKMPAEAARAAGGGPKL